MSIDPVSLIAEYILKPRVVHSLPGRVRIYVPALKQLKSQAKAAAQTLEEFVEIVPGVQRFSLSFISGNALVVYDSKATDEASILSTMKTMMKTAVHYRSKLMAIQPKQQQKLLLSIKKHLAEMEPHMLSQEKELELPDEIWC